MDASTVTAAIAGVIGAIIGAGGVAPLIVAIAKSRRDLVLDSHGFAQKQFDRMEKRIAILEVSEKECLEAKEQLSHDLGRLTEEVSHLRETLEAVTRQHPAMIRCDCNGIIEEWSAGAEAMFGRSSQEMMGQPLHEIIPVKAREAHTEAFLNAARSDVIVRSRTFRDVFASTRRGEIPVRIVVTCWEEIPGDKTSRKFLGEIYSLTAKST